MNTYLDYELNFTKSKNKQKIFNLNKSFVLSLTFHTILIFGVTFTTFYKLPLIENSPIINVKFANSSQDSFGNVGKSSAEVPNINKSQDSLINKENNRSVYQAQKIKKLEANSLVSTEEAMYLNLWQRNIESTGDELILSKDIDYPDSRVQIMATIDSFGNLIKSEVLISSGNYEVDKMAIDILEEAAPFAPFDSKMLNEYSILEIIRDWNFSPK
jgi:outer membrane biosynthesis protein TonB